jgi:hypothetical protein
MSTVSLWKEHEWSVAWRVAYPVSCEVQVAGSIPTRTELYPKQDLFSERLAFSYPVFLPSSLSGRWDLGSYSSLYQTSLK